MTTTIGDLESRVSRLELRTRRAEEGISALVTTVVEVRDDVRHLARDTRWTRRGVAALLEAQSVRVTPDVDGDEPGAQVRSAMGRPSKSTAE